jgi:predicted amidohydrolase
MCDSLKLALIHCPLVHGSIDENQAYLYELNQKAARLGARIILNTEMGLSGYSFDSRTEIASLTRAAADESVQAFACLAQKHQVYLALGLAEREPQTGAFFNSALLLGPDGALKARRRKVTAESKWACAGEARQDDVAQTPWGKVGLLICSETYFSLIPRSLALKGADLLLIPANWPPSGIDPTRVWRGRALENGIYLAACNRDGKDKRMDMTQARSCLYDPNGRNLLVTDPVEPGIFMAEIPLHEGRFARPRSRAVDLPERKPGFYHNIYARLNRIKDLKSYLDLPGPGTLEVAVLGSPQEEPASLQSLLAVLEDLPKNGECLAVLPSLKPAKDQSQQLTNLADDKRLNLAALLEENRESARISLFRPDEKPRSWRLPSSGEAEPPMLDLGPARLGLAPARDLLHPELALAMAKRGCDLVAASGGYLSREEQVVLGLRGLERVSLALAFNGGGLICQPPEGHETGARLKVQGPGCCRLTINTSQTRDKGYEECLDYQALLAPDAGEAS